MIVEERLARLEKYQKELLRKLSNCESEIKQLKLQKNTLYSQIMDGRKLVISRSEIPPLCKCGCGGYVRSHRGYWNIYLPFHHPAKGMSLVERQKHSQRMKLNNPSKNPENIKKARQTKKEKAKMDINYLKKSEKGLKNISNAARKRMLSENNPMKNDIIHKKAMEKTLHRQKPKTEIIFEIWLKEHGLNSISSTGAARLWIQKMNPDYQIIDQKKVIELTMESIFIGRKITRTIDSYAIPKIKHYYGNGWKTLVIFCNGYSFKNELIEVLNSYQSKESNWSGIWFYDKLIKYEE